MEKLYSIWIRLKYQYYKLYWKVKPPKKSSGKFWGWCEVNYNVLDQTAVGYGIVVKDLEINDGKVSK